MPTRGAPRGSTRPGREQTTTESDGKVCVITGGDPRRKYQSEVPSSLSGVCAAATAAGRAHTNSSPQRQIVGDDEPPRRGQCDASGPLGGLRMGNDPNRLIVDRPAGHPAGIKCSCKCRRRRIPIKMERPLMALTAHGAQADRRRRRRCNAGETATVRPSTAVPTHTVARSLGTAGVAG